MQELIDFLVAECCADATEAQAKAKDKKTAA
jgi:hypothetical protein